MRTTEEQLLTNARKLLYVSEDLSRISREIFRQQGDVVSEMTVEAIACRAHAEYCTVLRLIAKLAH